MDIINSVKIEQAAGPQTIQAAAVTTGDIDMQGAESLGVVVMVGNIADTLDASHRIDLVIEHADDDGTGNPGVYGPCEAEEVLNAPDISFGQFLSIDDNAKEQQRHVIGYAGGKRFVKVTATPVSLATGGPMALLAIKGGLAQKPADNG